MKAKLELELTPTQYQQLVECCFMGRMRLEELWPNNAGNSRLEKTILTQAGKFGKEDMVFITEGGHYSISRETEDRLMPFMFDNLE